MSSRAASPGIDPRWSRLGRSGASSILPPLVLIGLLLLAWEALKFVGGAPVVVHVPWAAEPVSWDPPIRIAQASDLNLPHTWDIALALAAPAQRAGPPLWQDLLVAGLFTLRSAALGFVIGATAGLLIAVVLIRSRVLERSFAPYLVVSQTIPIVAIAPMIVIWLRAGWVSVAVISAYLAFFPVAVGALRGLRAIPREALELMRSYAASQTQTLLVVRFPTSTPYVFSGLKVAATVCVIGAIVGELPSGLPDGLGTRLLTFSQYYITGPERLWAAVIFSAGLGLIAFGAVSVVERVVMRGRARPAT